MVAVFTKSPTLINLANPYSVDLSPDAKQFDFRGRSSLIFSLASKLTHARSSASIPHIYGPSQSYHRQN